MPNRRQNASSRGASHAHHYLANPNVPIFHNSSQQVALPPKVLKKKPGRPTAEETAQKGNYAVHDIIGHRVQKGVEEWLVHWKGYGRNRSTWEPTSNLAGFEQEMQALKKKMGKKRCRSDMDEDEPMEEETDGLTETPDHALDNLL